MARTKKATTVSVFNWMGTLILLAIPGVNVLTVLLTLIAPALWRFWRCSLMR